MKNLSGQVGVYRRPDSTNSRCTNPKRYPLIPVGEEIGGFEVVKNDLEKRSEKWVERACLVRCKKCGAEVVRTYSVLRQNNCDSCGCTRYTRSLDTVWKCLYSSMRYRGRDFHLTLPQFKVVSQMPCAYCAKEPSNLFRLKYKNDAGKLVYGLFPELEICYSGLDRVDTTKGYVHGNVVPCCGDCNLMKNDGTLDEFFAQIKRVLSHKASASKVRWLAATLFDSPA